MWIENPHKLRKKSKKHETIVRSQNIKEMFKKIKERRCLERKDQMMKKRNLDWIMTEEVKENFEERHTVEPRENSKKRQKEITEKESKEKSKLKKNSKLKDSSETKKEKRMKGNKRKY